MIKELKYTQESFGDIEVVMASDSEGNSYSTIDKNFRYSRVYENESNFLQAVGHGVVSGAPQEIIAGFYDKAKVIGICLFPWQEHFSFADEAVNYKTQQEKGA